MKYRKQEYWYYSIQYVKPYLNKEYFLNIVDALEYAEHRAYLFREDYYDIRGYKWFIPFKITLKSLYNKGLVGEYIKDDFGGFYKFK